MCHKYKCEYMYVFLHFNCDKDFWIKIQNNINIKNILSQSHIVYYFINIF